MLSILFWNLNKKTLTTSVARISGQHFIDIIVLAENDVAPSEILMLLNASTANYHYVRHRGCDRFEVFVRFPETYIAPRHEGSRFSIQEIHIPGKLDFLLAIVHLPSKINTSSDSQSLDCTYYAKEIAFAEKAVGHRRTILIGDMNMNPFEPGMIGAWGLNATMCRQIANKKPRSIQGRETSHFFYNPMWSLMGDYPAGPPGTHYYERGETVEFFWRMYDQALMRPALIPNFENIQILTTDGHADLVNRNGIPRGRNLSDHLPILLKMNI